MSDLEAQFAAIDAVNGEDPNVFAGQPLAMAQGRLAQAWVEWLDGEASDALRLSARAHHLRRWVVPRSTYPDGRDGYLRWRRDQKLRHGDELRELLRAAGAADATVERAAIIVQKKGLAIDSEVQTFENAVSLTFIETQFSTMASKLDDDDKMVDVVAKTLRKMTPAGIAALSSIELDDRAGALLARAVAQLSD